MIFDDDLSPPQVRNLEKALGVQGGRPLRADPRHLRAPRAHARGAAPGRAGAARVHAAAAHRHVEAPRAAGRRHRHARPRRDPARDRPPARARADRAAQDASCRRVERERETQRRRRRREFRAALVGYTNAGKSTLFNALTRANVFVEDRLFATLDATTRQMVSPDARRWRCSPTPSASSASCRTIWSRRSTARWSRRSRPTCCCTWSTPPIPTSAARCAAVEEVLEEILETPRPTTLVFNKTDLIADPDVIAGLRVEFPGSLRGLGPHRRGARRAARVPVGAGRRAARGAPDRVNGARS